MRVILEMEDFVAAFRTGIQAKVHGVCKNRILDLQADENMYLSRLLGPP